MSIKKVVGIAAAVVGIHLLLVVLFPTPTDKKVSVGGEQWFAFRGTSPIEDDHDRGVYLQRGSWLPRQQVPYLEVHSEYPEVATWFCALAYLFVDAPSDPQAYAGRPAAELVESYLNVHSAEMAVALLLLIWITALLAKDLGNDPRRAWFLLLPGTMYFALSRYDVLPALMIALALLLLFKKRHLMAVFVLSVAVLTKWYPIVFLPLFLSYTKVALKRPILPALALSAATAFVVLGTTFYTAGSRYQEIHDTSPRPQAVISELGAPKSSRGAALPALPESVASMVSKLPEGWQTFATGGLRSLISPYLFQGKRITNAGGVYYQMQQRWFPEDLKDGGPAEKWILRALSILQFAVFFLALVIPMRSKAQLIRWVCFGTVVFVMFAKFYSPQWVIWTTALAAPYMRCKGLMVTTVLLELLIYVQLGWIRSTPLRGGIKPNGTFELTDFWFHLYDARIALTALLMVLVIWSIVRIRKEEPHLNTAS